jgi:hypothetical protein
MKDTIEDMLAIFLAMTLLTVLKVALFNQSGTAP